MRRVGSDASGASHREALHAGALNAWSRPGTRELIRRDYDVVLPGEEGSAVR